MRYRVLIFMLLISSVSACLDDPKATNPKYDQGPVNDSQVVPPDMPLLDRSVIPSETCNDEVGIVGTATPGITIIISGGASSGGNIGQAHPSTGKFCIPVKLNTDQLNTLTVIAHDPVKGESKAATVSILQRSCAIDAGLPIDSGSTSENIVLGKTAKTYPGITIISGTVDNVTDGDPNTKVHIQRDFSFSDNDPWIIFSFDTVKEISKIVVRWGARQGDDEEYYGQEYAILYSNLAEPQDDPSLTSAEWQQLIVYDKDVNPGDGDIDELSFNGTSKPRPTLRHIAIYLQSDGEWLSYNENFYLNEVEVWDFQSSTTVPQPTNVCQGY